MEIKAWGTRIFQEINPAASITLEFSWLFCKSVVLSMPWRGFSRLNLAKAPGRSMKSLFKLRKGDICKQLVITVVCTKNMSLWLPHIHSYKKYLGILNNSMFKGVSMLSDFFLNYVVNIFAKERCWYQDYFAHESLARLKIYHTYLPFV